jgi:cytochrome bd ubiquinol oxidase subunit II
MPFSSELVAAGTILAALVFYAVSGGADFGGGVWDLFAAGPRARAQRDFIASAIGPIWEANHVWLILVIVVLFTAFPPAFAAVSTYLHIPLALALVGIVLRGSAFVFRAYDPKPSAAERHWQRIFAISSLITPLLLGISAGALASGRVGPRYGFVRSWAQPFPIVVGLFTVALFGYLAAVYLTNERTTTQIREDFRRRAILAWMAVAMLAVTVLVMWESEPIAATVRLTKTSRTLQVGGAALALAALWSLWKRRFRLAQMCAAAQVAFVVLGWGIAQYPYLVVPDWTIQNAAAPASTLNALDWALCIGAMLLFPSFVFLYGIFKAPGNPRTD